MDRDLRGRFLEPSAVGVKAVELLISVVMELGRPGINGGSVGVGASLVLVGVSRLFVAHGLLLGVDGLGGVMVRLRDEATMEGVAVC